MESGKKPLDEIFNGNKYFCIPYYQRSYSWEEKQLKDFYDDFETQYVSNYYYGTILLQSKEKIKSREIFDIVDGQQRLTTLIIFVSCLIKRMRELNFKEKDCIDLESCYIKDDEGRFILSLQDEDNDFFNTYVLGDKNPTSKETPSQKRLFDAKEYFTNALNNVDEGKINEFIDKIYTTNVLVYLMVNEIESSMIFETTNDRGKALTNLEKTKSFLMYKACVLSDDASQIINKIRSRFNEIYRDYSDIENDVKDENAILYYSFIANEKWASTGKKKDYQHYMEIMKQNVDKFITKKDSKGLLNYIENYTLHIKESFAIMKSILLNRCDEFQDVLALERVANFYPLFIKCYGLDETEGKDNFKLICRLCEIFSFRIYVILGNLSNKAQTTWYALARDFNGDFQKLASDIVKLIKSIDTEDSFIEKLQDKKFYTTYETSERNYFFWKYENYLRENEQPTATPMSHDDLFEKKNKKLKLSIEHIVAQSNNGEQSRIISDESVIKVGVASKFEKEYLHSIGNLTIDPQSANSSKGKQDVEAKMTKYFVKAPYKCQNELSDFLIKEKKSERWTIESIEKRRDKILDFARATWCDIDKYEIADQDTNIVVEDGEEE